MEAISQDENTTDFIYVWWKRKRSKPENSQSENKKH